MEAVVDSLAQGWFCPNLLDAGEHKSRVALVVVSRWNGRHLSHYGYVRISVIPRSNSRHQLQSAPRSFTALLRVGKTDDHGASLVVQ